MRQRKHQIQWTKLAPVPVIFNISVECTFSALHSSPDFWRSSCIIALNNPQLFSPHVSDLPDFLGRSRCYCCCTAKLWWWAFNMLRRKSATDCWASVFISATWSPTVFSRRDLMLSTSSSRVCSFPVAPRQPRGFAWDLLHLDTSTAVHQSIGTVYLCSGFNKFS